MTDKSHDSDTPQMADCNPRLVRRFKRAVKTLNEIMNELRETHPGGSCYLANDQLHLMGGPTHDDAGRPLQDNSIVSVWLEGSGGGDW